MSVSNSKRKRDESPIPSTRNAQCDKSEIEKLREEVVHQGKLIVELLAMQEQRKNEKKSVCQLLDDMSEEDKEKIINCKEMDKQLDFFKRRKWVKSHFTKVHT